MILFPANAINCYNCTSLPLYNQTWCADPFDKSGAEAAENPKQPVNCTENLFCLKAKRKSLYTENMYTSISDIFLA